MEVDERDKENENVVGNKIRDYKCMEDVLLNINRAEHTHDSQAKLF